MAEFENTKTISVLPEEFVRRIENDLNKISEGLPDFLSQNYEHLSTRWNYPNVFEFLVGLCVGNCEGSYLQAYQQVYQGIPSEKEILEIRKIIARRRAQIEQGVIAFLEEHDIK